MATQNGKMKDDEFIGNMPYLETRIYVKKVLAGYRAYSRLSGKKDSQDCGSAMDDSSRNGRQNMRDVTPYLKL